MEQLLIDLIKNAPSLIGLGIAVWLLYRQNDRLLTDMFARMDKLEEKIENLENRVVWQVSDSPTVHERGAD